MTIFDINNIAFKVLDYPISYVELIGTLFGFACVYFAARTNILTWPTGIVNEFFLFILFFKIQLYADMFLQVYFFIITLFGWYYWKKKTNKNSISTLEPKAKIGLVIVMLVGTWIAGCILKDIHLYFPQYFTIEAAYPFVDSFVMVMSIVATILLAQKKIETWYLWIVVDLICVFLFFKKGVLFLSLEYFIFLGMATYGLYNWKKEMQHD